MAISQRPFSRIFHHQERRILATQSEVQQRHDMGMAQTYGTSLIDKSTQIVGSGQTYLQHLERDPAPIADLLSQVHIAETASPKPAQQAIITHYLPYALQIISHHASSLALNSPSIRYPDN